MKAFPLFITIPHAGEWIPPETPWLEALPREVLLLDIDRFVDELYAPAISQLQIPSVATKVHRYAADLNRYPDDIDASSVEGAPLPAGKHSKGFHWVKSTQGHLTTPAPMPLSVHDQIVARYHDSFHEEIASVITRLRSGAHEIYHLDCHSMPSYGTEAHEDAGTRRPEIVLSDFEGKSTKPEFLSRLDELFKAEGFEVRINWPYKGGRITQRYGKPATGHHTVQIEINRAIYMDEQTRERKPAEFKNLQERLARILKQLAF